MNQHGSQIAFGASNKFLSNQGNQPQQAGGFDPTAMSFGGSGTGQRSFSSVGNQPNTQNQGQSNLFMGNSGNSTFSGNTSNNTTNLFGGNTNFALGSNNLFGQGLQNPIQPSQPLQPPQPAQQTQQMFGSNQNNNRQASFGNFGSSGTSMFANSAGNSGGNAFGQNNPGGNMFNQGSSGNAMFSQGGSGGGGNLFQNLGSGQMMGPPSGVNPNLMAMRK